MLSYNIREEKELLDHQGRLELEGFLVLLGSQEEMGLMVIQEKGVL